MDQNTKQKLIAALQKAMKSKEQALVSDRNDAIALAVTTDEQLQRRKQLRAVHLTWMITCSFAVITSLMIMILNSYVSYIGSVLVAPTQFVLSCAVTVGVLLLMSVGVTIIIDIVKRVSMPYHICSVAMLVFSVLMLISIWTSVTRLNGIYRLIEMIPWL